MNRVATILGVVVGTVLGAYGGLIVAARMYDHLEDENRRPR